MLWKKPKKGFISRHGGAITDNESNLSIALDDGAVEDALSAVEDQKIKSLLLQKPHPISEKPATFAKKQRKICKLARR